MLDFLGTESVKRAEKMQGAANGLRADIEIEQLESVAIETLKLVDCIACHCQISQIYV